MQNIFLVFFCPGNCCTHVCVHTCKCVCDRDIDIEVERAYDWGLFSLYSFDILPILINYLSLKMVLYTLPGTTKYIKYREILSNIIID